VRSSAVGAHLKQGLRQVQSDCRQKGRVAVVRLGEGEGLFQFLSGALLLAEA
jgi:hypothetical protein